MKLRTALLAFLLLAAHSYITPDTASAQEEITVGWKSPVNQPGSLTMSSGGRYCASVDKDGTVRLYDIAGKLLWKQRVEGATDALIAHNGQSVLVYSRLNPVYKEVHFFQRDGKRLWKHQVEGAVWSGAVSSDGMHAAVTTGERYVYIYRPDPGSPRYRRWRLEGIGYRVVFTPDSKRVVVGTWQESQLACYDLHGKFQWRASHDEGRQYDLHVSADSKSILGLISATPHDPGNELCFWNASGKMLWKKPLSGFEARALVSPQSQYVAVSYADYITEGTDIIERKVAVYQANGELSWEKGGLFFGPRLIALSPTGASVIVSDGERSLYNIDRRGRILSKLTLQGTVRQSISSEDGRSILLYCGDGWLYLLKVR